MKPLTHFEIIHFFLALAVLLAAARLGGALARRYGQPDVLGEIAVGIVLGPSVLGALAPGLFADLFGAARAPLGMQAFTAFAAAIFLLAAGMELDVTALRRNGRAALFVGSLGIVLPAIVGFASAALFPQQLGWHGTGSVWIYAAFFATALSISALPVIARTLMDLGLYDSPIGLIVISAAIIDDLVGWLAFGLILAVSGAGTVSGFPVAATGVLALAFVVSMITSGRAVFERVLPRLAANHDGMVVGLVVALMCLAAAFAEWIGLHAVFGAFVLGVTLGSCDSFKPSTREVVTRFATMVLAPVFFVSIGLRVDFVHHFDPLLTLTVVSIACVGKILGCAAGARLSAMPPRVAWAVGFGMNSRGAMEIILGLLALEHGIIAERMFVSLVVTALVTSMMSGPCMQWALRQPEAPRDGVNPGLGSLAAPPEA